MFPPAQGPLKIQGREAWEDEMITARIWDRPCKTYHTDTPIYPWVPRTFPDIKVSFKLGYKP